MKHRNVWFSVLLVLGLIFISSWSVAATEDSSRYARIRYIEGDVAIYPNDADRPSDATINSPVLDGDEIETQNGRAECPSERNCDPPRRLFCGSLRFSLFTHDHRAAPGNSFC